MAIKPFAIQGADLTLGGVNLQAGTTGIVIPGVTQAANYKVEEINDTGDQTFSNFPLDTDVYVVDAAIYNTIVADGSISAFATYTGYTDGEGYIDNIEVDTQGTYTQQQATTAETTDMYVWIGTTGAANDRPLVPEDWIQVPFRPKMRAGVIENIGGGAGVDGLTGNTDFTPSSVGNVKYELDINGDITLRTHKSAPEGPNNLGPGISLGDMAGTNHGSGVVAIGNNDVGYNSKQGGVYIGREAGWNNVESLQGEFAIAIGTKAARNFAQDNSITLNATGVALDPTADGLYIKPVREVIENTAKALYYNTTTGEVSYADPTGGGGSSVDPNIWVQTFVSDTPLTDFPQVATSVEYDSDGNVIALFSHLQTGVGPDHRYYSVGKYTPAGTRIWTARFADDVETDGWGLAVDSVGGWIYVAGKTGGDSYPYYQATLTKINTNNGSVEWNRIYDFGYDSSSNVVDVDSDGHPVMVGYVNVDNTSTKSYLSVTKIDKADGTVTWSRKLDGQADEEAYGMGLGPNNEVVAVGYMSQLAYGINGAVVTAVTEPVSNVNWITNTNVFTNGVNFNVTFNAGVPTIVINYDDNGNRTVGETIATVLGSNFGGTDGIDDMVVKVDSISGSGDQDDRMVVVKYASDGTIAWQKAIQFDEGWDCTGADADIDSQGNVYICGQYSIDNGGTIGSGIGIVKLNSMGVKQWSRRVVGDCITVSTSIVVGPDDKLYISGVTGDNSPNYTWIVAKYDFNGLVEWQRLIDNTATWSFSGQFYSGEGGGSNIAVRQDYVALSGGFGDLSLNEDPYATVLQVPATGNVFTVGNWDFTAASFSGVLSSDASDIAVINAGLNDSDNASAIDSTEPVQQIDISNFLIGTLLTASSVSNELVNGAYSLTLENNGTVTLPAGGTIKEGYVTSNPTIQLTPASPDVASQKLVIKGGAAAYNFTDNGISISYSDNTAVVDDILTFNVYSSANASQTLYWWIYPENAGIGDSNSGTVAINGSGSGSFTILIDNDDYEFTVRVSPENNNYGPGFIGVETGLINASAPTFATDHHLHLTTGDLTETSIFLGTDNHNVRTTTDGNIQVTTTYYGAVSSVASVNSQGGYNIGTYTGLTTTGGTGSGLTVNATSNGGYIGVITVVNPGKGYTDDDVITLVGGDGLGCTFVVDVPTGISEWQFNTDGSISFPTKTTPDYRNRSDSYTTGPTLQLAKNGTDSTVVITGPAATVNDPYAKRLVIQGQSGWRGSNTGTTGAEGGDVYIWGGYGGEGDTYTGDGGDVKLRGGHGGLSGGYVRVEAGEANQANGEGGFVDINAGDATYGTVGYPNSHGGNVEIRGGRGYAYGGDVNIHTASTTTHNQTWVFSHDGSLTLPKNSSVSEVTPATGAAANVIVIQSSSSIANVSFVSLPPAPILNYTIPGTDIIVNVDWTANGIAYYSPSFTVVDGGAGHTGGGQFGGGEVLTVPYDDMGITIGGNWTWYVADIASDLVLVAGNNAWVFDGEGGTTFPNGSVQTTAWTGARITVDNTTASLADTATGSLTITGYKGYVLYKIQTSHAAWVRIYTDTASRSADSGRSELTDPAPGSGVIAEVITTGAETVLISPGTIGFSNESTPSSNIELAVTNKSGTTTAIMVTLTVLQLEV